MTIEEMGSLGEFFGSIAVFVTLLYLVAEIRLTRKATMAQIYQQRSDAASSSRSQIGASPAQALAVVKFRNLFHDQGIDAAVAGVSETDLAQVGFYFSAQIHRIDNIHYQYHAGLVDDELFEATVVHGIRQNAAIWSYFHLLESHRSSFVADIRRILDGEEPARRKRA
ncbi:MAG: hypothetical protein KDI36_07120 [Pseudomonadales bacterium]|nr:hypothetical protein [Pseudomonadales bacterium]